MSCRAEDPLSHQSSAGPLAPQNPGRLGELHLPLISSSRVPITPQGVRRPPQALGGEGHVSPLLSCGPPGTVPPRPDHRRRLLLIRRSAPCLVGLNAQPPPIRPLRATRASVCRASRPRTRPGPKQALRPAGPPGPPDGHPTSSLSPESSWHPLTLGALSLVGARDCQVAAKAWAAELADTHLLTLPSWPRPRRYVFIYRGPSFVQNNDQFM
ncbi:hypothetical protein NDU88_001939 [Pleurodeles waltl]|uniref:Uncharacterized protein n=1 Tax=Pleurodeles waltl TaxID=8319 RepID=A0AAV7M6Q5_PLEWA|nr:hypothetical protein NDU88_001939 [Pleurodeles waltl]